MMRSRGLAILETSMIILVLLALLIGAVGFVHLFGQSSTVNQAIDRQVYDAGVKPFTIEINPDGTIRPAYQEGVVRDFAMVVRDRVVLQLLNSVQEDSRSLQQIRVEVAYATVPINRETGQADASGMTITTIPSGGSLTVPSALDEELPLRALFLDRVTEGGAGGPSLAALPTGRSSASFGSSNYFPVGVMLGARAFLSLEGSGAGTLLESVGVPPFVGDRKVVWLRGEVGR
jgi:hypothetical protein